MATLRITAELLLDMLFLNGKDVEIVDASFDPMIGALALDVRGADVPDADSVVGVVTSRLTGEMVQEIARETVLEAR